MLSLKDEFVVEEYSGKEHYRIQIIEIIDIVG
jgi:hypothetical protein